MSAESEESGSVSGQQQRLLMAFRPFLRERLVPTTVALHLMPFLSFAEIDDIRRKQLEKSKREAVDELLQKLVQCETEGWFAAFLQGLRESGNEHLASYIEGTSYDNIEDQENFQKLIGICAPSLEKITPSHIMPHLTCLDDHDRDQISADERNHGPRNAVFTLLSRLVNKGGNWFQEFVAALRESERNDLADLLDPDPVSSEKKAAKAKALENCDDDDVMSHTVTYNSLDENEKPDLESSNPHPMTVQNISGSEDKDGGTEVSSLCLGNEKEEVEKLEKDSGEMDSDGKQKAVVSDHDSDKDVDESGDTDNVEFSNDEPQVKTFQLRNYQMELVEPALEGKNTIICAPTGSGKTITALYIMQRHLAKGFTANRPNRIVFLVNQRPLVEQQGNVFEEYLIPMNYRVIQLTGETTTIPMAEVVEEGYDVIVLTAQILENALRDNIISSLSVFTMLIFDECHHTQKLEPYNCIMARYRDMKIDDPKQPRPQIIGLTASLGVGKSRTQQLAVEHILKICANLDADKISTVVKNKNELQRYVPVPDEELLNVQGRVEDRFFTIVNGIMSEIETVMLSSQDAEEVDPKVLKPPGERGTQAYEHWVVTLGKQSVVALSDDKTRRMFKTCTDHLRKYNDSLFVNKDARTKDALQYLNKYFDNLESRRQGFDKLDLDLFQLFKENKAELGKVAANPKYKNPVLEKLGDLILKAYKDKPDSRCIVLTKTRASCYALKSWIEETAGLKGLNPGVLIGGGGSGENPGMTESQQSNLLEMFKEGNHSIIICTSVGQEGIDIQLCNLVFRYNYANNEIGRVQAKGRSRAKSGKTFLVAGKDTGIAKREQLNMMRENMMYKAIQEIRRMSERSFANKINEFQAVDQVERRGLEEAKAAAITKRRKEAPKEAVKFNCKRCNIFACLSTDFREFKESHHLLIDEAFQERIKVLPHKKPQQIDEMYKHSKVHCKKCMQDWGIVATIQAVDYPILKIDSFVLIMPNGVRKLCRKWKDKPFNVERFSEKDLQKKINVEDSASQN